MITIAIVGAGPGLSAAVARRFGTEGSPLPSCPAAAGRLPAGDLSTVGVTARGYAADVREPDRRGCSPRSGRCVWCGQLRSVTSTKWVIMRLADSI
jgi:hypothetical protein